MTGEQKRKAAFLENKPYILKRVLERKDRTDMHLLAVDLRDEWGRGICLQIAGNDPRINPKILREYAKKHPTETVFVSEKFYLELCDKFGLDKTLRPGSFAIIVFAFGGHSTFWLPRERVVPDGQNKLGDSCLNSP